MEIEGVLIDQFVYLPLIDLLYVIPCVCKKWNQIIKSNTFWRTKCFYDWHNIKSYLNSKKTNGEFINWKRFVYEKKGEKVMERIKLIHIEQQFRVKYDALTRGDRININLREFQALKTFVATRQSNTQLKMIDYNTANEIKSLNDKSILNYLSTTSDDRLQKSQFLMESIRIIKYKDTFKKKETHDYKASKLSCVAKFISLNGIDFRIDFFLYLSTTPTSRKNDVNDMELIVEFSEDREDKKEVPCKLKFVGDEVLPNIDDKLLKLRDMFGLTDQDISLENLWDFLSTFFLKGTYILFEITLAELVYKFSKSEDEERELKKRRMEYSMESVINRPFIR